MTTEDREMLTTFLGDHLGPLDIAQFGPVDIAAAIRRLLAEHEALQAAIRAHRDQRGDDRCWRDDETLYAVLPEGFTPPARDSAVELERCRQYIASRQNPQTEYVSPQREIERLKEVFDQAKAEACHWLLEFKRLQAALCSIETHDEGLLGGTEQWMVAQWHDYIRNIIERMQDKARASL